MASCSFAKPAGGANVICLCCVVLLTMFAITLKGACAKTVVLYNKSGSDLVLIFPQSHINKVVLAEHSVELEGAQQQRGVMIQVVGSGAVAGPLDIPDNSSQEGLWPFHSTAETAVSIAITAPDVVNLKACIPNVVNLSIGHSSGGC